MRKPITQKAKSPLKQTAGDFLKGGDNETGVKATRSSANTELIKGAAGVAGKPGKVTGSYKKKMSNDKWKEYLANETPEQKAKRQAREVKDGVREAATPGTPATPDTKVTTTRKEEFTPEVYRESTQTTPWENRWANKVRKQQDRTQRQEARKDLRSSAIEDAKRTEGSLTDKYKAYRSKVSGKGDLSASERNLYNVGHNLTEGQHDVLDTRASQAGYEQMGRPGETVKHIDKFRNADFSSAEGTGAKGRIETNTDTEITPSMRVTEETVKEESMAKMRYSQNVGFKGKTPLKKGYFK